MAAKVRHGDHLRLAAWRACFVLCFQGHGGFLLVRLMVAGAHTQPGTFGNEIRHPCHGLDPAHLPSEPHLQPSLLPTPSRMFYSRISAKLTPFHLWFRPRCCLFLSACLMDVPKPRVSVSTLLPPLQLSPPVLPQESKLQETRALICLSPP